MGESIGRRRFVTAAAGLGAATASMGGFARQEDARPAPRRRIRQSVSRWCYGAMSLDDLCKTAREIGLVGIDLLGEGEWETVRGHGLICTMANGIGSIADGWNRVENHDRLMAEAESIIPKVAGAGLRNVITFSGNRKGLSDDAGMANCIAGLKRVAPIAERHKVTVCIELLNSKRSHKDYQCDRTSWGVGVCKGVGSSAIKLLYDVFHMQIMEGDICDTIRENIAYIGHIHTGGVPGRNEIDETQEINYARVCRTLVECQFEGYVAHEFVPKREPIASLKQAFAICDV